MATIFSYLDRHRYPPSLSMQLIIIILIKERKGARVLKDDCDDSTSSYTMLCLSDQDRVVCEKLLKSIRSG